MLGIALLVGAFAAIVIGAELFTNALEWFGFHLSLSDGAVGSVFAAIGTALPETMIPLIAIGFGGSDVAHEIGLGAILGAPFMLSTLALTMSGAAFVLFRRRRAAGTAIRLDREAFGHDLRYFFIAYCLAIATAFLPQGLAVVKPVVAVVLIALYLNYVRRHIGAEGPEDADSPPPLRLDQVRRRRATSDGPGLWLTNGQLLLGLACVVLGALVFVGVIEGVTSATLLSPALLTLFIAPIATELPETANSVLWIRRGRDHLAMGNITGAMVFQSAIPPAIALILAPSLWSIGSGSDLAFSSAAVALVATAVVAVASRGDRLRPVHLAVGGLLYVGYVVLLVALG